jgi:ubiquitin carboxyl-terminal hydrolase 36/42
VKITCIWLQVQVVWVHEEDVLSQEAYILFYAKQGTPWFSNFIEKQKQCIDLAILNTSPKSVFDNVDASTSSSSLPLNYCGDVNETSDATEEVFMDTSSGPIDGKTDDCEDKENKVPVTVPLASVPSCEAAESPSESILRDKNSNQEFVEIKNVADVTPKTPSRSPSPEIYREDPPGKLIYSFMLMCLLTRPCIM